MHLLFGPAVALLFWGCTLSLFISGRVTVWLVADVAISFAFVPIVDVAGFAAVFHAGRAPQIPFKTAAALRFAGNAPWLLWMVALALFNVVVPPRSFPQWIDTLIVSAVVPAFWCAVIDFRFSRSVLQRRAPRALGDVFLQRLVAWPLALAYYGGIGMWTQVLPSFFPGLFS